MVPGCDSLFFGNKKEIPRQIDTQWAAGYGLPCGVKGAVSEPTEPHWELNDLSMDPHEMTNLAGDAAHAATLQQLKAQLVAVRTKLGDTDQTHPEVGKQLMETAP